MPKYLMEYLHMYQLGSKVSLRFVSFQHILIQWQKNPGDAFAFLYNTSEQTARTIFLREGLFFETLASTTGNTESGWGFVALKSLRMPS